MVPIEKVGSLEKLPKKNDEGAFSLEVKLRPSASEGWWLSYLLMCAYFINCCKYERSITFEYKFSTVIAFGMLLQTEVIHYAQGIVGKWFRSILHMLPTVTVSIFIIYILKQDIIFSLFSAFVTLNTYQALFLFALKRMPKSFTYGEAAIVAQGLVIFLTNLYFKLTIYVEKTTKCIKNANSLSCEMKSNSFSSQNYTRILEMEQLSTVLQIGLLGVLLLIGCCYFLKFVRGMTFYALLAAVGTVVVLFPIDNQAAVFILFRFLTEDLQKLCMIILYISLIGMTVATVLWQINRNEQSNTRTRKMFHVLIVLVFFPGLIYQCALLFVTSGIALALLIVLEAMRIIQLQPIYNALDHSVKCFIDEKDAGFVVLTPIYLLVGCAIPLWIHPCPCDFTDSAGFNILSLMSGVISVGIGDTAASIIGSKLGKIKWWNSQKTAEGTFAAITAQGLVFPLLVYFGLIRYSAFLLIKFLIVVTIGSLVETFTDQVDNLVLPLVTFILLSL